VLANPAPLSLTLTQPHPTPFGTGGRRFRMDHDGNYESVPEVGHGWQAAAESSGIVA